MKRRDFLTLAKGRRERIAEVSCASLRRMWVDARERGVEIDPHLLAELEGELAAASVLRLVDRDGLAGADADLRLWLGDLVRDFRARGGRVETSTPDDEPPSATTSSADAP